MRHAIGFTALLVLLALTTGTAHGHALLLRSEPPTGVAVGEAPRQVSLWFSEPVQVAFNGVEVVDGSEKRVDTLNARVSAEDPARVDVDVADLPQGSYVVRWQVTSADNHVVHGTTWFAVGFAATPPPVSALIGSSAAPAPGWEIAGRWLVYAAVLFLVGASLFDRLVLRTVQRIWSESLPESVEQPYVQASRRAAVVAGGALALGQVLWLISQLEAVAGTAVPGVLTGEVLQVALVGSRFAVLWWVRLLAGAALAGYLATGGAGVRRLLPGWAPAALSVLLLVSVSLGSHATATRLPAVLAVPIDVVHLAAASIWLGGLVQLLLLLRALHAGTASPLFLSALVPRVSRVALVSVGVLVATGLTSAWSGVQTLPALVSTPYGQALLLKVGLVLLVLAFAAVNLLVMRPRFTRPKGEDGGLISAFRGVVLAEVTLGAGVLLATGLLTSLAPPGHQPLPSQFEATRQAGDLRVTLTADPNWVGVSTFSVALADRTGAEPADVRSVTMTFTMQGMNMGRTTAVAAHTPQRTYEASGYFVGMPGISEVGIGIQRSGAQDESAVFQIEVPDVTQIQFGGLRASAGLGLVGIFGLLLGLVSVLVGVAASWVLAARTRVATFATAAVALIAGCGMVLLDGAVAIGAPVTASANPVRATSESLARGQALFSDHCQVCHGTTGVGNGPAAASLLPPPSDLTLHARWHGDPQLFWFVTNGVAGTGMPPFSELLLERDRWDVINYVHVLANAPTASVAVPPARPEIAPATSPAPTPSPSAVPSPASQVRPSPGPSPGRSGTSAARAPAPVRSALTGRIVYGPDTDHDFWVIQLPGGQPQRITSFGRLDFPSSPAWSPDGKQIAYSFYQLPGTGGIPLPPGTDVYVMNADGSGQHAVATHDVPGAVLQNPLWSRDGRSLYVTYQANKPTGDLDIGIDRIDLSSGSRTRVVPSAVAPAVSPDGKFLAYALLPSGSVRSFTLWRSGVDGSTPLQLIGPNVFVRYSGLRFSPDSQRIVFAAVGNGQGYAPPSGTIPRSPLDLLTWWLAPSVAHADGDLWDLWTIDADGRNLRRITAINEDLPAIAWSPDGRYVGFLGGGSAATAESGVAVMDAAGGDILRLTAQPGHRGLDWTPGP